MQSTDKPVDVRDLDFIIPGTLLVEVLNQLGKRPFYEVVTILESLRTLEPKSEIITE